MEINGVSLENTDQSSLAVEAIKKTGDSGNVNFVVQSLKEKEVQIKDRIVRQSQVG